MKQVSHIFLKDVRRHWPEISASLALLAAFGWKAVFGWTHPGEMAAATGFAFFDYRFLAGFIVVVLPIAWIFLILRVVQSESLVGDRQFWITRPYEWRGLLTEKVLLLFAFINLPVLVLQIVLLWRAGFHPTHYVLGLLWMQFMLCLILLLPTVTLAVITATVIQSLLALLFIVLYIVGMVALSNYIPSSSFSGPLDNINPLLLFATCLVVIVLQYARRKTKTARLCIVALGVVLLLILVATPYRAIVAHEYPSLGSGTKAPFEVAVLPGKNSADVPVTEKDVQVSIPVSIAGLAPESIINIDGVLFELSAPGKKNWDSGWSSGGRTLYPEQGGTILNFTLKRRVFDRMRDTTVTLHVSLAYTLYRDQNQREFVIPNGKFEIAGVGVCSAEPTPFSADLSCMAPMRRPESFLITADASANTCPLGNNEVRATPGRMTRAWQRGGSDPADFDIDPVQTFDIYAAASNPGKNGGFMIYGFCPGTPVVLSNPVEVFKSQTTFSAEGVNLMDYREPPPQLIRFFRERSILENPIKPVGSPHLTALCSPRKMLSCGFSPQLTIE